MNLTFKYRLEEEHSIPWQQQSYKWWRSTMDETSATRRTTAAAFNTRQRRDVTDRIGTQTASATASLATASESATGCIAAEARAVILRRPSLYRLHYVLHFVRLSIRPSVSLSVRACTH